MRQRLGLCAAIVVMLVGALYPTLPAGASHPHTLDPSRLALGAGDLPPGTVVAHSAVSNNADADNLTPSPDGYSNDIKQLHPTPYTTLGRITGYRERFHFSVASATVTTQYLASIFATPEAAKAALSDATTGLAPIALIGKQLTPSCMAGDVCAAYYGINGTNVIIYTALVRGPVLIEFASAVDSSLWPSAGPGVTSALYAILAAADARVQAALAPPAGSPMSSPSATPTATATPIPSPVATSIAVPPRTLGSFYLALGDSYAAGYLTEDQPYDRDCKAPDAPGFVCVFWRYLKEINGAIGLDNLGDPGADSCELAGEGHHCYSSSPHANPVDDAVKFISEHPGQVSPITLTIGGNDLLALLPTALNDPAGTLAKLPAVFDHFRANLDRILARLRAAAPNATIIVTTQPDPFGGLDSPPLPLGLPQLAQVALDTLDGIMKAEAPRYGAIIADSAAAFDAYPGGGSALTFVTQYLPQGKYEIHPTPKGYKVYGETLIKASGYRLPMHASLTKKNIARGKSERVRGTTSPGLTVRLTITLPHHKATRISVTAGGNGFFSNAFNVGKKHGTGTVQACVVDPDQHTSCSGKMSFGVR